MKGYLTGLVIFFLVGCSGGGPSESDIKNSVQKASRATLETLWVSMDLLGKKSDIFKEKMGFVNPETFFIENVEVLDSKETANGDFLMKISLTTVVGEKRKAVKESITMTDMGGEWVLVQ